MIGIGAGPHVDGQILVLYDILDITPGKKPRFVKNFMAGLDAPLYGADLVRADLALSQAIADYAGDAYAGRISPQSVRPVTPA